MVQALSDKKKVCLLVLGMHRSGTSALTRMLNLRGASLPISLMESIDGNSDGHWESNRIVEFHDALFTEMNTSWSDWQRVDRSLLSPERKTILRQALTSILEAEYRDKDLIVIKDPRICKNVEAFSESIRDCGYDIKIIFTLRNPIEVIESLKKRNEFSNSQSALLWLRHNLDAEFASRNIPRYIYDYGKLLNDWKAVNKDIAHKLDIDFPRSNEDASGLIDDFINTRHYHNRSSTEHVTLNPLTRGWISTVYEAFMILTHNPQSKDALETLDKVRLEFANAESILVQMFFDQQHVFEQEIQKAQNQLEKKITAENQALNDLNQERNQAEQLRQELSTRDKALKELHDKLAKLSDECDHLKKDISTRDSINTELHDQCETHRLKIENYESQAIDLKSKNTELDMIIQNSLKVLAVKTGDNRPLPSIITDKFDELNNTLLENSNEIKDKNERLDKLEMDIKAASVKLKQDQDEFEKLRCDLLEQNERKIQDIISIKTKELQSIKNSYTNSISWKITKPFRLLMKLFNIN